MPKDEFDFDDPFELNGMAFLSHEDTTNEMTETFIEEFMRMGYGHRQILALFRNPQYLGPHMAYEKRGEPFIRDLIADVFARWGKVVAWPSAIPNPLTPALSPSEGERENQSPANREPASADCTSVPEVPKRHPLLFPRPLGGGEGQGENSPNPDSRFEPMNRSRRREEADTSERHRLPPPHVGGYQREVQGEGARGEHTDEASTQSAQSPATLTDPTGSSIPEFTV